MADSPTTEAPAVVSAPATTPAPATPPTSPVSSTPETTATAQPQVVAGEPALAKPSLLEGEKPAVAAAVVAEPLDIAKLALPEGFTLHEKGKEVLAEIGKKFPGLSTEAASALLGHHAAEIRAVLANVEVARQIQQDNWVKEVKADTEIGGAKLEPILQSVGKVIAHFGGTEAEVIREALTATGAGNNPHIIRIFYRMAKVLNEGGYIGGDTAKPKRGTPAEVMYPNLKSQES